MSELGQLLRETRKSKNLSIEDIQELTKIRRRYLQAIENGDYHILPGEFYARAFIKNYAEVLHLNVEEILERFKHELPQTSVPPIENLVTKRTRKVNSTSPKVKKWLSMLTLYTFLLLVIFIIYLAAVKYMVPPVDETQEQPPNLAGPIGEENANLPPSGTPADQTETPATSGGEEVRQPENTPEEPQLTLVDSQGRLITYEFTGTSTMILKLQASNRLWYELTQLETNKVLDTAILAANQEKEWDLSEHQKIQLNLGNTRVSSLYINDMPVDLSALPSVANLVIHYTPETR